MSNPEDGMDRQVSNESAQRFRSRTSHFDIATVEGTKWERFLSGDCPMGCRSTGFIVSFVVVLLVSVGGVMAMKMSDVFGWFVFADPITGAYFSHEALMKDATYFTENVVVVTKTKV
jgi:hypothetical protein